MKITNLAKQIEEDVLKELEGALVAPDGTIKGAPTEKQVKKTKDELDKDDEQRYKPIDESKEGDIAYDIIKDLLDNYTKNELARISIGDAVDAVKAYGHKGSKAKKIAQELQIIAQDRMYESVNEASRGKRKRSVGDAKNTPFFPSKDHYKKMIKLAYKAGARKYDIIKSLARDLSKSEDAVVKELEKNNLIGMTESVNEGVSGKESDEEIMDFYKNLYDISKKNYKDKRINVSPEADTISKFSHSGNDTTYIKNLIKRIKESVNESTQKFIKTYEVYTQAPAKMIAFDGDDEAFDIADGILYDEEGLEAGIRKHYGIRDPQGWLANKIS